MVDREVRLKEGVLVLYKGLRPRDVRRQGRKSEVIWV